MTMAGCRGKDTSATTSSSQSLKSIPLKPDLSADLLFPWSKVTLNPINGNNTNLENAAVVIGAETFDSGLMGISNWIQERYPEHVSWNWSIKTNSPKVYMIQKVEASSFPVDLYFDITSFRHKPSNGLWCYTLNNGKIIKGNIDSSDYSFQDLLKDLQEKDKNANGYMKWQTEDNGSGDFMIGEFKEWKQTGEWIFSSDSGHLGRCTYVNGLGHGLAETWYPDDTPHKAGFEYVYTTILASNGLPQWSKDYYANGRIASHGTYKDGELDGKYILWHSDGQLKSEGIYKLGQEVKPK